MQKIKIILLTLLLALLFIIFLKHGIKLKFLEKFASDAKVLKNNIPIQIYGKYKILLGSFKDKNSVEKIQLKIKDIIVEDCEIKINQNSKGLYVLTIENIVDKEIANNINFRIRNICIGSIIKV